MVQAHSNSTSRSRVTHCQFLKRYLGCGALGHTKQKTRPHWVDCGKAVSSFPTINNTINKFFFSILIFCSLKSNNLCCFDWHLLSHDWSQDSVTVFRVWHQPFTCFPALGASSIFSALEAVQVFSNVWSKLRNYKRFQALLSSNIMSRKNQRIPSTYCDTNYLHSPRLY